MVLRLGFRQLLLTFAAAFLLMALGVGQAPAATSASPSTPYGKGKVVRAFKAAGIRLQDTGYGTLQPVVTLAEIKSRADWSLGVYVYSTKGKAADSFRANARAWRASGIAASLVKNVVVAAVPKGRVLGAKAPPWPMPKPVAKALAALAHPSAR